MKTWLVLSFWAACLCGRAQSNEPVTVVVKVVTETAGAPSPAPPKVIRVTNHPPNEILPMAVKMRVAAQLANSQAAPWLQRFIAVKVVADARARLNEDGLSTYSTNYFVTYAPVQSETNAPLAWGVTKAKTFRLETEIPTKKGDEFLFWPVPDGH